VSLISLQAIGSSLYKNKRRKFNDILLELAGYCCQNITQFLSITSVTSVSSCLEMPPILYVIRHGQGEHNVNVIESIYTLKL
jgi:hypothetical protein